MDCCLEENYRIPRWTWFGVAIARTVASLFLLSHQRQASPGALGIVGANQPLPQGRGDQPARFEKQPLPRLNLSGETGRRPIGQQQHRNRLAALVKAQRRASLLAPGLNIRTVAKRQALGDVRPYLLNLQPGCYSLRRLEVGVNRFGLAEPGADQLSRR